MPMRYADLTTVQRHLAIRDTDTDAIARVTALENGLAASIDGMMGRAYGTAPVAETRTVDAWRDDTLVLPVGVRSVTGIAYGGTWDGAAWTDEDTLATDDYRLAYVDDDGNAYGITALRYGWRGPIRITGVWADQDTATVPADLREAMNVLVVREYRRLHMSPSEQIGPDGQVVPAPGGWSDPLVKAAIARYSVVRLLV